MSDWNGEDFASRYADVLEDIVEGEGEGDRGPDHGEIRLAVAAPDARAFFERLIEDPAVSPLRLIDLFAIDRGVGHDPRFEIVYRLLMTSTQRVLRVHARVGGTGGADPEGIESVCALWPSARWLEREVFDLFGLGFSGHPDLRRLFLENDFKAAPLRKDFDRRGAPTVPPLAHDVQWAGQS